MRLLCVVCLVVLLGALSCGGSPETEAVEVGCRLNSDCEVGEACEEGRCVASEQCEGPQCPCAVDEDCPGDLLCDPESGACFTPRCFVDNDCALGQVCLRGACLTDVEADRDRDGVPDNEDSCPELANADQEDADADGQGDACDLDDDNDGVPDAADNCPLIANNAQADANADGLGNACDEVVGGITVVGTVDASAGGAPDPSQASVFITGRREPAGLNGEGAFVFEQALAAPGPFAVRVEWPGFIPFERVFQAPDALPTVDVGALSLIPQARDAEQAAVMRGVARLQGREGHQGILVKLLVGESPVASTLTDAAGAWAVSASRVAHSVAFEASGFLPERLEVRFNEDAERFEVEGEPLEEVAVVLRPDRSASLSGQLVSELDIQDWAARVRSARLVGAQGASPLLVDNLGAVALAEAVVPGVYGLELDLRGFLPLSRVIVLEAGDNPQGELAMVAEFERPEEAFTMTGRVCLRGCDAPGVDHSGTIVRAVAGLNLVAVVVTDTQGAFTVQAGGEAHELELSRAGFETQRVEVAFSDQRQTFVLGGAPLAETPVVLQPLRDALLSGQLSSPIEGLDFSGASVVLVDEGGRQRVPVEPDGRFGAADLTSGLRGLEIELEGHEPVRRLETLVGGANELGAIELVPVRVGMLGKIVTQVDGRLEAVDGVSVRLRRDERLVAATQSDERGEFVLDALPVGYSLSLSKDNFLPRTFEIAFEDGGFTLDGLPLNPQAPLVITRAPQSDRDGDGIIDVLDNCPDTFDPALRDIDGDGLGDVCDRDADGDGLVNGLDNCPFSPNPSQEDVDGLGRGFACDEGTLDRPLLVGCGLSGQRVDTRERAHRTQGTCGGSFAPEVAYRLGILDGETWSVSIEAQFPVVSYLLDAQGREVDCQIGGNARWVGGEDVPAGTYLLVVDGFNGALSAGPMEVSINSPQACSVDFSVHPIQPALGSGPSDVALGDVNGDGFLDMVSVNNGGGTASVLLGQEDGFAQATSFPVVTRSFELRLGDVNGDGNLDILALSSFERAVSYLLGDGAGGFAPLVRVPVGIEGRTMAVGDVNEDGHLDILTAGFDAVNVLLGDGAGGFAGFVPVATSDFAQALEVEDINADGHLDVLVVNVGSNNIGVWLGDGAGGFTLRPPVAVGDFPSGLSFGDLNRDGNLDMVVCNADGGDLSVLLGNGQGGFGALPRLRMGNNPFSVAVGDLDADGALDVLVGVAGDDEIAFLRGDGTGRVTLHQTFPSTDNPTSLAVGDLNQDGLLDIVAANSRSANATVVLSDKRGFLAPLLRYPAGNGPFELLLVDLDADGNDDIVTANARSANLSVLLGDGRGGFGAQQVFAVGQTPLVLEAVDMNADGHLDVISLNRDSEDVRVMLGDGSGGLSSGARGALGRQPSSLKVGDVSGDGHPDLMITDDLDPTLLVFFNDGQGGLEAPIVFNLGEAVELDSVSDFNGDGTLDLLISGASGLRVMLSDGQGGLGEPLLRPIGAPAFDAHVVDLNGDGRLDVVFGTFQNNSVGVVFGDGQGGFGAPAFYPTGDQAAALALADFNEDGRPDVAMPNRFNSTISVLMNDGQGGLAPALVLPCGSNPAVIAAGDVDGDGHMDIVTANQSTDTRSILLGDGRGGFSPHQTAFIGDDPARLILKDVDGNGVDDMIFGNGFSNDVSILAVRTIQRGATRLSTSDRPPCSPRSIEGQGGQGASFQVVGDGQCRVVRLELEVALGAEARGQALLKVPTGVGAGIVALPNREASVGLWRPEFFSGLARFEDHPLLSGRWTLDGGFEVGAASLRINTFPDDPFGAERPAAACVAGEDQPSHPDFVCRLGSGALEAEITDGDDEDVFLLEGAFDGAFVERQVLGVVVEAAPGAGLAVELRALRAAAPLATAVEIEAGRYELRFTVPARYSNRYFAIHVRSADSAPYTIQTAFE